MKSDSNTSPYKYIHIQINGDTFSDMSLECFDSKNDIHICDLMLNMVKNSDQTNLSENTIRATQPFDF